MFSAKRPLGSQSRQSSSTPVANTIRAPRRFVPRPPTPPPPPPVYPHLPLPPLPERRPPLRALRPLPSGTGSAIQPALPGLPVSYTQNIAPISSDVIYEFWKQLPTVLHRIDYPWLYGVELNFVNPNHAPTRVILKKFLKEADGNILKAGQHLASAIEVSLDMIYRVGLVEHVFPTPFQHLGCVTSHPPADLGNRRRTSILWNRWSELSKIDTDADFDVVDELFSSWRIVLMHMAVLELRLWEVKVFPRWEDPDQYHVDQIHDLSNVNINKFMRRMKFESWLKQAHFSRFHDEFLFPGLFKHHFIRPETEGRWWKLRMAVRDYTLSRKISGGPTDPSELLKRALPDAKDGWPHEMGGASEQRTFRDAFIPLITGGGAGRPYIVYYETTYQPIYCQPRNLSGTYAAAHNLWFFTVDEKHTIYTPDDKAIQIMGMTYHTRIGWLRAFTKPREASFRVIDTVPPDDPKAAPVNQGASSPGNDQGGPPPGNDQGAPSPGNDQGGPPPGNDQGDPPPGNDQGAPSPGSAPGTPPPGSAQGDSHTGNDQDARPPGNDQGDSPPGNDENDPLLGNNESDALSYNSQSDSLPDSNQREALEHWAQFFRDRKDTQENGQENGQENVRYAQEQANQRFASLLGDGLPRPGHFEQRLASLSATLAMIPPMGPDVLEFFRDLCEGANQNVAADASVSRTIEAEPVAPLGERNPTGGKYAHGRRMNRDPSSPWRQMWRAEEAWGRLPTLHEEPHHASISASSVDGGVRDSPDSLDSVFAQASTGASVPLSSGSASDVGSGLMKSID
ncbi:hypothetical protein B0T17DRAFT_657890 [Bombardia bombarda]|uniref:Phosphatidylinositol transfer protein SFH5 n=1 Tax=Bombardia bombarda TaxID=252184 RepID=A0AA39TTT5_9PEZI|nr:hypothetical protein B0T17DRAFT_657890 [Bombardia bombarda]